MLMFILKFVLAIIKKYCTTKHIVFLIIVLKNHEIEFT
jgi:hypothetical protein